MKPEATYTEPLPYQAPELVEIELMVETAAGQTPLPDEPAPPPP